LRDEGLHATVLVEDGCRRHPAVHAVVFAVLVSRSGSSFVIQVLVIAAAAGGLVIAAAAVVIRISLRDY
jgi:hypothetical protein